MDRRFVTLTASLSALTFGGVWIGMTPRGTNAAADLHATFATVATASRPVAGFVHYPGCAAVRAVGKAPLLRDQPGYRAGLDRDGDGVACEPLPGGSALPRIRTGRAMRLRRR